MPKKVVVKIVGHKLTVKQKLFCDEYLKSGNATSAAIKAGYSMKTAQRMGSENLSKPLIKAYIDKKMREIESRKIADATEVMEYYTSVLRGEITEEVPIATTDGEIEVVSKKPSIKDKTTVAKEILKRYPYVDPVEKQKLKKLVADTRIAEAKANVAERLGSEDNEQLDVLLDKLVGKVSQDDS